MFWGALITCLFVSILFFFFSYLIWKKREFSFIAGYNEESFKGDKDKLAKAVGLYSLIIGLLTLLLPFGLEFIGTIVGAIFTIIIIVGTIGLIIYINKI
ncbi:DUF3784 domain-containing protein [Sporosarcina sp. ACRSL]|uniref:DUF3784 domain-containing protein n=1 Tax=Sporosarcina sp. ACRSL TaxID=2918215 RepID=UPI001EF4A4FF|nr:DUF3784 domain-containing protein [Sporosarcina sp. ACRSL]MCG7343948.1 DUF3784 domain-containing protein [Sporosarcina sp. ACRSL]